MRVRVRVCVFYCFYLLDLGCAGVGWGSQEFYRRSCVVVRVVLIVCVCRLSLGPAVVFFPLHLLLFLACFACSRPI